MNKKALDIMKLNKDYYINWCKSNNKPHYKKSTKQEFFKKALNGDLKLGERNEKNKN